MPSGPAREENLIYFAGISTKSTQERPGVILSWPVAYKEAYLLVLLHHTPILSYFPIISSAYSASRVPRYSVIYPSGPIYGSWHLSIAVGIRASSFPIRRFTMRRFQNGSCLMSKSLFNSLNNSFMAENERRGG